MPTYYIEANCTPMGEFAAQDKREAVRKFMSCAGAPADTPLDDTVLIYRVEAHTILRAIAEKYPLCVIEQDPVIVGVCRIDGVAYHDFYSLCRSFDIDFYQYLLKELRDSNGNVVGSFKKQGEE